MTWTGSKPPLRAAEWEVRPVDIAVADRLVELFHYAGGASKTAVATHGLFPAGAHWDSEAIGAAWWLPPTKPAAVHVAGVRWEGVLGLSRLVVAPEGPGNAAGFLMARSMALVDRVRWPWFVTYADQWRGHTGAIYRATGWREDGLTQAKPVYTINGRMVATKAGPKTRTHKEMLALGAIFHGRHAKTRFIKEAP